MADAIPAIPADTVNGCTIKGKYTATGYYGQTLITFKEGVKVFLPQQTRKDALISCTPLENGQKVSVLVQNLSDAKIFGSDKKDSIRSVECQNCIFNTSEDNGVGDYLYIYNTKNYCGVNRFYLGENDLGYAEHNSNGKRVDGKINTKI